MQCASDTPALEHRCASSWRHRIATSSPGRRHATRDDSAHGSAHCPTAAGNCHPNCRPDCRPNCRPDCRANCWPAARRNSRPHQNLPTAGDGSADSTADRRPHCPASASCRSHAGAHCRTDRRSDCGSHPGANCGAHHVLPHGPLDQQGHQRLLQVRDSIVAIPHYARRLGVLPADNAVPRVHRLHPDDSAGLCARQLQHPQDHPLH